MLESVGIRISNNILGPLFGALNTQTLFVYAPIAVHSPAYSAFVDRQDIVLLMLFAARHTGKFFSHLYTPFSPSVVL